jgi:hypothetical protein
MSIEPPVAGVNECNGDITPTIKIPLDLLASVGAV